MMDIIELNHVLFDQSTFERESIIISWQVSEHIGWVELISCLRHVFSFMKVLAASISCSFQKHANNSEFLGVTLMFVCSMDNCPIMYSY